MKVKKLKKLKNLYLMRIEPTKALSFYSQKMQGIL